MPDKHDEYSFEVVPPSPTSEETGSVLCGFLGLGGGIIRPVVPYDVAVRLSPAPVR
ncbi:uncharacterized protein ARMOST_16707 [Armillaria ostoyae]|uniref:Uncharacterized protein n=1 Tax=Armillaria ostoyae TaxID=47428 RepID=A0A284RWZ5_ARMOS|nr:uncharacterized protein ARMOST_16707 [Armillaria ostoyae]